MTEAPSRSGPAPRSRRVLVVPEWYPTAAQPTAGIFCREHARAAAIAGHDVVVVARESAAGRPMLTDAVEDGLRVVRVRTPAAAPGVLRTPIDVLAVGAGLRHLRARGWRPEILHAHVFSSGAVALPFAVASRIPLVVSEHLTAITRGALGRKDRAALRLAYRGAARVLPCSEDLRARIAALVPRARVEVVPNVVDGTRFHPGSGSGAEPAASACCSSRSSTRRRGSPTCSRPWRCCARPIRA